MIYLIKLSFLRIDLRLNIVIFLLKLINVREAFVHIPVVGLEALGVEFALFLSLVHDIHSLLVKNAES